MLAKSLPRMSLSVKVPHFDGFPRSMSTVLTFTNTLALQLQNLNQKSKENLISLFTAMEVLNLKISLDFIVLDTSTAIALLGASQSSLQYHQDKNEQMPSLVKEAISVRRVERLTLKGVDISRVILYSNNQRSPQAKTREFYAYNCKNLSLSDIQLLNLKVLELRNCFIDQITFKTLVTHNLSTNLERLTIVNLLCTKEK